MNVLPANTSHPSRRLSAHAREEGSELYITRSVGSKTFQKPNFATELEANYSNMSAGIQQRIGVSLDLSICSLHFSTDLNAMEEGF